MFPLALLCKETGILVPVFVFVIELTVFRFKGLDAGTTRILKLFHGAIVVLPIMALAAMLLINPEPIIGGYKLRDYSLGDRLLTQARVIFLYLHMSLSPTNGLLGLYHDDFVMSRSLMNPWTTSMALVGLAALLALGWISIKRMPLVALAIFWFLGGHLLESTFIPLEMIHEHRNYLPLMGLVLGLCGLLFQPRWPGVAKLAPVLSITVAIAFGLVTAQRSEGWSSLIKQAEFEVRNHPNSERANIQMARVYATLFYSNHDERYFAEADKYFNAAIEHSTISPAGFIGRIRIFYMAGKEPPTELFQALARRLGSGPQVPAAPTLIQNIANCALLEDCKIPHDQMLMILSAYLNNPDVPDQMKQIVALVNAQYHADVLKDGPGALYILQKVVLEQPTYLNGRRNLARLYRFSGDYEKALHEVKVARSLDKWRQLAPELDDEEKKIRAAMADPTKGTLQ
jgi:hypothetical protein